MQTIIFLTQLLLVLQLSCSLPIPTGDTSSSYSDWIASTEFSECSATCDGGFQVRSVRCLDKDGVISSACSMDTRPDSIKVCGQVNCTDMRPDEEIYPDFGIYHFHLEDAMSAVMKYLPRNDSLIGFTLAVTEEDDTVTIVDTLVSHQGAHTEVEIIGVTSAVGLLSNNEEEGGPTFLHVWEKSVVEVSEEELLDLHLAPGERIVYHDYTLYRLDEVEGEDALGETLVEDLHSLYFCDEFRPYLFQGNKSLPLHGPGTLFYRSDSGDAGIYFLTTPASPFLDIVHTLEERLGHSPPADGMNGGIPAPQQAYPLPHSSGDGVSLEPALPLVVATERPQGVKEEVLLPQEEEEEKVFYPDAATTQWVPQKQTGTTILQTVTTNTVTNDVITTDIITTDVTTDVITTDAVVTGYE